MVTKTALLKQMEELIEEPGLTCCICREGYKFQVCVGHGAKQSPALPPPTLTNTRISVPVELQLTRTWAEEGLDGVQPCCCWLSGEH